MRLPWVDPDPDAVRLPWVAADGERLIAQAGDAWHAVDLATGAVTPLPGPALALLDDGRALLTDDAGWPALREVDGTVRSLRP